MDSRGQSRVDGTFRSALIGAAGWASSWSVLWTGLRGLQGGASSARLRLAGRGHARIFSGLLGARCSAWVSFGEFSQGVRAAHAVGCSLVGILFSAVSRAAYCSCGAERIR